MRKNEIRIAFIGYLVDEEIISKDEAMAAETTISVEL